MTTADVRRAIQLAREKAPGVARKLIYRISAVFKWGNAEAMCTGNPATGEALALPKLEHPFSTAKPCPMPKLPGASRQ